MKEGYRFVDCDMHIMEPVDLFEKYLDPALRHRVTSSPRPSNDSNISQYNRIRGPLVSARANTNVMFAVERGYDAEAQVMGCRGVSNSGANFSGPC